MASLAGTASLIAPLDVVRFTISIIALLTPGYAVATLARPASRHSDRIALAMPCACALVAISGLCTALLRLPFTLATYAVLALPLTLAGGYTLWRQRKEKQSRDHAGRWWLAPVGVAGLQVGSIALGFAPLIVPPGGDVVSHVMWTDLIRRTHVFPIALLSSHANAGDGGFYPPVFHAFTALVLGVAPMATYHAVFYTVVTAIALLPLALFSYVRAATGHARVGGLAALAALAFAPLPFMVLKVSYYPFILSMLFIPALAITLRDALGHGDRRAMALAAILGIGLFYTHPTEFVTVALLTAGLVVGQLRGVRSWARAGSYGIVIAAVWLAAAFPALRAVHNTMANGAQTEIQSRHFFSPLPHVHLQAALDPYMYLMWASNFGYLLPIAAGIGIVWCLWRHRWLGLVAIQVIMAAVFVDANSYDLLQRVYQLSFPWALSDRLAATHYWVALPLAGIGLDVAAHYLGRIVAPKALPFRALIALPLILLGLALPLRVTSGQAALYAKWGNDVAPADLQAIAWLARHAPAGSMVANDGQLSGADEFEAPIDAGQWMPALGGPRPFFGRGGLPSSAYADAVYVLRHIADNPLPPRAIRFITRYGVSYVFYGARVRPGPHRHLNLGRLLRNRRLHLAYSSAPSCHAGGGRFRSCPATASYVFALGNP